jgi:hypothetical protein
MYRIIVSLYHTLARAHTHTHTHTYTHTHTVCGTPLHEGPIRRSGLYSCTTHNEETNIHAHGGIRTRNPSNRATTDLSLERAATGIGLNTDGIKRCLKRILIFSSYVVIITEGLYSEMATEGPAEIEMERLENFLNRSLCTSPCLNSAD